ncbi:MAG: DNA primase DnaG [archaeon GB-1867-097]|nr:DNA primase DnaG [Candidatus Culexmicrobium thermophilum]
MEDQIIMYGGVNVGGASVTAKYNITVYFEVEGIVEKPDVIGAIFGQTEGLLGDEMDLRELQRTGRIGRIQVKLETRGGRTTGEVVIPSSLDKVETALMAAAIETIDKVGPCSARFYLKDIEDLRVAKRKKVIERAKEILRKWEREKVPETREIIEKILKEIRMAEVIKFGEEKLPAGPDVPYDDTVIIVEGRADVINLLRHGYRNAIAIEGASIPKTIIELTRKKTSIAFVDGDRAGELILKELLQVADIDYVARAPPGKEVEELTAKEIVKCLSNMVSAENYITQIEKSTLEKQKLKKTAIQVIPEKVKERIREYIGTLKATIYDEKWNEIKELPVRDLAEELHKIRNAHAIIFDGVITQRIVDLAGDKDVKIIVGARVGSITKRPVNLTLLTFDEIL